MKSLLIVIFLIFQISSFAGGIGDSVMLNEVVKVENVTSASSLQSSFTDSKYLTGKRISEALGELSSVHLKRYGNGQLASIAVRGTSATQTEVQWNGIKLNSPSLGQCDLSLFTLGVQDDLQLIRTGYRGIIGGTLRMVNQLYYDSGITGNVSLRAGSFKTFEGFGALQYANNRFAGSTSVSYLTSANNFRYRNPFKEGRPYESQTNAAVSQLSFMQQFGMRVNPNNEIRFSLWLTEADRQLAPVMSNPYSKEAQYDYSVRTLLGWKGNYRSLQASFTSGWLVDEIRYVNRDAGLDETSQMQALRNNFILTYRFPFNLVLNGELNYDFEQARVRSYDGVKSRNIVGVKLYADYYMGNGLKFHAGFREDLVDRKLSAFAPQLAVNYSKGISGNKHALFAGLLTSRNFRFPNLNDLYWSPGGNPNLKQEKSWNGELNFRYTFQKTFDISLSNFYIYVEDWIQWTPRGTFWTPENLKNVFSRGFEATVSVSNQSKDRVPKLIVHVNASYSYTKTTNLSALSEFDMSRGKQLIYVPLHRSVLGLQLSYRNFYLRSVNSYQSLVYTATDNSQYLKGYFIVNLETGKDFYFGRNEIGVSFKISNLADAQYQNIAQRPMPGRSFEGTLRYKFN